MALTTVLADALVPIFVGLLLGYFAGLRGAMDNKNVRTLITYVMSFAVPASLFLAIATTPRAVLRDQIPTALVLTLAYAVIFGISFLWSSRREKLCASDSSVVALTVAFPNSAAVGLPLLASVFGAQSKVAVATSLAMGSITVSPITLAILEANRDGKGLSAGGFAASLALSLKRPIVWAPLIAVAFSVAGANFPSYIHRSLAVMGSSAEGSALVLTGLVISAQRFEFRANTLFSVFLKNVLQPPLALGAAMTIHLSLPQTRYVTLISAIPCGFFGAVFGKDYGSSPEAASSGLIASYAIGIASLAAWIAIVNHLQ
jgi:malonate transporter and related proteins